MTNLAISLFTERMINLVGAEVVLKLLRETEDIEEMGGLNIQVKCEGIPCRLQFQHTHSWCCNVSYLSCSIIFQKHSLHKTTKGLHAAKMCTVFHPSLKKD